MKTPVWVEAKGGQRLVATTLDISDHGLGLWIAGTGIGGGDAVRVRFQNEELPALVRHAQSSGKVDESIIGLEVERGISDQQAQALLTLGSLT